MKYDIDYFIAKFSAIPEEKWCTGKFMNDTGQCCALGFCLPGYKGTAELDEENNTEFLSIQTIFGKIKYKDITDINDRRSVGFKQPTPKQRVLAALEFITKNYEQQHKS